MAESDVDRNLLFAVIALEDDLIDQKQLAEVCAVWASRMSDPLADLHLERGWITADDRREVERKLERKLKKHQGNARETLGVMATAEFRDDDLPGVSVGDDSQTEATRAGQQLGTPAYMAPEQAEGRSDLIDGRTDVYGLGAILFEILTGRAPHSGKSVSELLKRIIAGETPRTKSVEPSVPGALDAVCARAMAKKRADRYAKASDLAEDVQRWLADEPVRAYRDPVTVRLGRLARRHRTAFVGASALLVAAVVALSIGTILLGRANERTTLQRDRAEANLHKALVASLGKDVEAGLSATDGSVGRLNALEKVVDDLGRLEPAQAAATRRRVYRRFAQSNEESLRRPALRPDDVAAIERSVALLETRAPDEVPALRRSLRERLQAWEPVVDLAPPYRSLDSVFDLSQVRVGADGLHPQESSGSDTLTTISARGNLRCEARFAARWESATSLGLTIRVTPGHTGQVNDLAYSPRTARSWRSAPATRRSSRRPHK